MSYDREWTWTIEKSGDVDDAKVGFRDTVDVTYEVTVEATSANVNRQVLGSISITNANPYPATIAAIDDTENGTAADVA
jgi:hypothetical protein